MIFIPFFLQKQIRHQDTVPGVSGDDGVGGGACGSSGGADGPRDRKTMPKMTPIGIMRTEMIPINPRSTFTQRIHAGAMAWAP
jgi:hypothetical protein